MNKALKVIMWLGLGGGIGYFAGRQVGINKGFHAGYNQATENALYILQVRHKRLMQELGGKDAVNELEEELAKSFDSALDEYRGGEEDPELWADDIQLGETDTDGDEIPDMPTAEELQIDNDIPQLHPQTMVPELIGEEEYNANIWGYELETLLFYEMDEVLYNESTQSIIENPDDILPPGALLGFGGDPNNPIESLFVKNDTYGTLFRIDRLDAAFCDAVDGSCSPSEEDDGDNPESFTEERDDDYWDDV